MLAGAGACPFVVTDTLPCLPVCPWVGIQADSAVWCCALLLGTFVRESGRLCSGFLKAHLGVGSLRRVHVGGAARLSSVAAPPQLVAVPVSPGLPASASAAAPSDTGATPAGVTCVPLCFVSTSHHS